MTFPVIQQNKFVPEPAPLTSLIGKDFYKTHNAMKSGEYDEFWEAGGRGSLKSSFVALKIVMGLMEDPLANAVAYRKVQSNISDSVRSTFAWAIDTLGWTPFWHIPKALNVFTRLSTGQRIIMRGLDDPQKSKSIKARKGYFKYLWFEEGAEYDSLNELDSVTRSVLRGGPEFIKFVTFNPPVEPKHWINVEAEQTKERRHVNTSCYLNAPREWLGPKFLADAEDTRERKPDVYANEYLGKSIGRSDKIIFSGCYTVLSFEVVQEGGKNYIGTELVDGPYFGADWGFSQDPTVLVKCWLSDTKIYIEHEAFGVGVMLDHIPAMFDRLSDSRRFKIRADCARPETIAHVKQLGFNIEGAEKWKGSVEDGITWLKSRKIVIHQRCANVQDEAVKYSYKVDRITQDVSADIVDAYNHGWDAIRYAFAPMIKPKPKGLIGSGLFSQR